MFNQKGISSIIGLILILVFCVASFSLILYVEKKLSFEYNKEANILQSSDTLDWQTYTNNDYGFLMQFPNLWNGYTVIKNEWNGQAIDNLKNPQKYTGPLFVFKNQDLAKNYSFLGIGIMIFTKDVWKLVEGQKIAVSAAPVGPEKIGENSKYVFALPPRWIGFADNLYENKARYNEVQQILKTFKVFEVVAKNVSPKDCPNGTLVNTLNGPQCDVSENEIIAGWKTYTNTEYGFEVNYSSDWVYEKESVENSIVKSIGTFTNRNDNSVWLKFTEMKDKNLYTFENLNKSGLFEKIKLNNIEVVRSSPFIEYGSEISEPKSLNVYFYSNGNVIEAYCHMGINACDEILSTFKFTK